MKTSFRSQLRTAASITALFACTNGFAQNAPWFTTSQTQSTTPVYNGNWSGIYLPGTTAPSQALDVGGNISVRGTHFVFNSTNGYINWGSNSGDLFFRKLATMGNPAGTTTTLMTIKNNGYLGLGTTAPTALADFRMITSLNVKGLQLTDQAQGVFMVPRVSGWGYSQLSQENDAGIFWSSALVAGTPNVNSGLVIAPHSGSAAGIRIAPDGKVGVGTASPLAKLHVDNGAIRVTGTNPAGGPIVLFGGNTSTAPDGEWGIQYDASTAGKEGLNFKKPLASSGTAGNNYLFLSNTGRVGINTNDPTAQLTVNGKVLIGDPAANILLNGTYKLYVQEGILTEKLRIAVVNSGAWADYVFDKNYKLSSLKEVEEFVETHKHLPGVPSASEVEKEGIDMVDMDATLLKKIEELTLYIIAQDKRIISLEKECGNNK